MFMCIISQPILRHYFIHSKEEETEAQKPPAFSQSGTETLKSHVHTVCSSCSPIILAIAGLHIGALTPISFQMFKDSRVLKTKMMRSESWSNKNENVILGVKPN